jgi:hypothetical protein
MTAIFDIKFKTQVRALYRMVEKSAGTELFMWPLVAGRMAQEMALLGSMAAAKMAQAAFQSADAAIAKYIELTEQELKRSSRRETVKVE